MKIFLYSFSVYSCYLFLISSASVRSIPFLSFIGAHLCMKCSLGISNFLEEISSLSHSVVFLYFFALITQEVFLISPCYSLDDQTTQTYSQFSNNVSLSLHICVLLMVFPLRNCLLFLLHWINSYSYFKDPVQVSSALKSFLRHLQV